MRFPDKPWSRLNGSADSTMIATSHVYGEEWLFDCDRTCPYLCPIMYRIRLAIRPVTMRLRALVKAIQGNWWLMLGRNLRSVLRFEHYNTLYYKTKDQNQKVRRHTTGRCTEHQARKRNHPSIAIPNDVAPI